MKLENKGVGLDIGTTKIACLVGRKTDHGKIEILGISFDSKKILKKFKEKHNLPFNFLSDFNKEVGSVYGANKYYFFPSRMTFLIDEKGRVVHIFDEVDLYSHPKDILRFFNQAIKE